ncbi:PDDEXK-like family protein [Psychrobacter jeotgali]|uniref:PDDEXK-like family protein n=1 Tax=Psychrobacter jeotgali TaxID=179010 RepID=UPI00191AF1A2|nr:PD-(D/E)XK nuclease family protein [Psychrobacter jeotgali]
MEKLQNLLNEVIKKTDALKTAQALYSRQLAPKFNTFDYINTDELGLSRILADLLNPKGSHGQQESFLRLFIEHCLPNLNQAANWQSFIDHIKKTNVLVEETTWKSGTSRRMDIYLECKADGTSYGICIENKPYASDQFKQLQDYANELTNRNLSRWHLIYLNEYTDTPSEHSINSKELQALTAKNQFSALKFSDLIDWLKACQVECQNNSVTEFLAQLIKFIQKHFMGIEDMNMDKTVLEVMQQSDENIEASIQIANNLNELKKQLIQKLIQDLKAEFSKNYDKGSYQLDISNLGDGKNYEQVNLISPSFNNGYICFEFQSANFDRPCLGFKFNTRAEVNSFINAENMKTALENNLSNKKIWKSPLWPAGYYFSPQDWRSSSKAWLMIRDGEMASKIMKEMDAMFQILNGNGCFNG